MQSINPIKFLLKKLFSFPIYFLVLSAAVINSILLLPKLVSEVVKNQFIKPQIIFKLFIVHILTELVLLRIWEYSTDIYLGPRVRRAVVNESMEHLINTDCAYYDKNPPAEVIAKIAFLEKSHNIIVTILNRIISDSIGIAFALFRFFIIDWLIGVTVLIWLIGFAICMFLIGSNRIQTYAFETVDIYSKNTASRVNILQNIFNIKIFAHIRNELRFIYYGTGKEMEARIKIEWSMIVIRVYMWASYTIMHRLILYFIYRNGISSCDFILIRVALNRLKSPITYFAYQLYKFIISISDVRNGLTIFNRKSSKENYIC